MKPQQPVPGQAAGPEFAIRGRYSDGRTAEAHDVVLKFADSGLEFTVPNNPGIQNWPYRSLTSTIALKRGLPVQIGSRDRRDARLLVADGRFAFLLRQRAKHLAPAQVGMRTLLPMFIIAVLVVSSATLMWKADFSPSRAIAQRIPDKARVGLGRQVVKAIVRPDRICSSKAGDAAMARLMGRLQGGAGESRRFEVKVGRIGTINAFAAPGEQIVVSNRLLKFVETPEELAGVIAHEMGHGLALHPETGLVRALGISTGIQLVFGGSAGGIGDMGLLLLQLRYTRAAEREADSHAIRTLKIAGIDPVPFSAFFERLEKRQLARKSKREGAKLPERLRRRSFNILSTHPPLKERAERIRNQKKWKTRPSLSATEWQALRDICETRS